MSNPSLLIVGCGDLGQCVARILGQRDWLITGVKRAPGAVSTDFSYQAADYSVLTGELIENFRIGP
jgi:hypothetical protein